MKPIISPNIRLRHPELFAVGEGSIIDDYCYFSTRVVVGRCSHIANNCSVGGGRDREFRLGDFSSVSAGVRVWCASDDFVNDVVCIPPDHSSAVKTHPIVGDVIFGNYTAIGANSVVMPGVHVPEGAVIGAMSFVPAFTQLEPWTVYAGVPARKVGDRNRASVLEQVRQIEAGISKGVGK